MINVGVNLLWLRPGLVGGTESYARRILRSVAERPPEDMALHLFGTKPAIDAVRPEAVEVVEHIASDEPIEPVARVVVERRWLPRAMASHGLDVVYHPGGTVPFRDDRAVVVTIHDLQPLDRPQNFSPAKVKFLERSIPQAVKRATVVTTPSEWVREQVVERFDIDAKNVVAVSAFADPVDSSEVAAPSAPIAELLGEGPVFVYPAMTLEHKNHAMLFAAFARALKQDSSLQLVCVGPPGRDDDRVRQHASRLSPRIHMLGHVPKADLLALYQNAESLVFPSLYEGFGLPVIEAQRHRLPVICSNTTAMPEVAGDGARLIEPTNVEAWADAMVNRGTASEREELIERGVTNAERYSSVATAERQWSAYQRAMA